MKATWQGYVTIGQLTIPVRLYGATKTIRPRFTRLHEKDNSPTEQAVKCQAEGKEIPNSETIRAAESEPGSYVVISDEELERTAATRLKSIEVRQFCDVSAIDPIYYEKPYYVVPSKGGERAYALLREVLVRGNKVAIVQFVLYNKEHLGALQVRQDIIVLHQMRFAAEIVPRTDIDTPPLPQPNPAEIGAALAVLQRLSGPFFVEDYHDEQSERLLDLITRKKKGLPPPRRRIVSPHATPDQELLAALRATLESKRQLSIEDAVEEDG
ncbi:MAG: Ku protein [Candidatus Saccharimonadales bacterium]